ncbi:hypothetical protein HZB93_04145 [Candidatus Falkowbacteria bacterium]|nr:hypothetical protein [Candidatus Falkowbacteria bacterium]
METKLVALTICFVIGGCGLDTGGMGEPDDGALPDIVEEGEPDIGPDEAATDVSEADQEDVAEDAGEDETADETEPDEASPDEAAEDVTDVPDETEPEDADDAADEAGDEASDEGGETEDGEPDPCALPEIPATGIFVWYCFDYDLSSPMSLEFQAERAGIPVVSWRAAPGCSTTRGRRLECTLTPTVWDATYIFNIRLDPGVGIGWSCGPELLAIWGTPHVWLDGVELTVTSVTNGDGGCNHSFLTPSL